MNMTARGVIVGGVIVLCAIVYAIITGLRFDQTPPIVACALPTDVCDREFNIQRDASDNIISAEIETEHGRVLVLYQNYGTAESRLDNERGQRRKEILRTFLTNDRLADGAAKSYVLLGTADLAEVQTDFDSDGICEGKPSSVPGAKIRRLPQKAESNECLALMRAYYIGEAIAELQIVREGDHVEIDFDASPFMREADDMTQGDLFKVLKLSEVVDDLATELGISTEANHGLTATDQRLQALIKERRDEFDRRLFPFRSVVVYAKRCRDQDCER